MSNAEICLIVYNTINIKGICVKQGIKRDYNDIQQIVYEIILTYDNEKMNNVNNNGALLSFVWLIIRNQISKNRKSEWKMLNEHNELNNTDLLKYDIRNELNEYDYYKESMLLFIEEEYRTKYYKTISRMSYGEQNYYIDKLLLKNKVLKRWTLDQMRDKFGVSRNTINNSIQNSKEELRKRFKKQ